MNDAIGATHGDFVSLINDWYWSSTEYGPDNAYRLFMDGGYIDDNDKGDSTYVRCVRDQ